MKLRADFPPGIRNVIFDFGGVVLDVNIGKTIQAFVDLGAKGISAEETQVGSGTFFEENECGKFSESEFLEKIRSRASALADRSDNEILAAWDALLGDFVPARIELLRRLRGSFRLFLLSNTNASHRRTFLKKFSEQIGGDLNMLFEKTFYSDLLGCVKPSPEIFQKAVARAGIVPAETLFIDDNAKNILAAEECGLHAYLLVPGRESILDLFTE